MRATTSGVDFLKSLNYGRVVGYLPDFLQDFTPMASVRAGGRAAAEPFLNVYWTRLALN
jgi:hypothetical protein